jgi:hypothetical protein
VHFREHGSDSRHSDIIISQSSEVRQDCLLRHALRVTISPFAIAASGQLADPRSNVMLCTGHFSLRRESTLFFFSPVVSFAFRPPSFFGLVDSSCIYNPYIIVVLVVHWNKREIEIQMHRVLDHVKVAFSLGSCPLPPPDKS